MDLLSRGMLWVDDTVGRPMGIKLEKAVAYYRSKYGADPNICYVHPSALEDVVSPSRSIKLVGTKDVLPHHFLLGMASIEERSAAVSV